jgi:hypothetical protein
VETRDTIAASSSKSNFSLSEFLDFSHGVVGGVFQPELPGTLPIALSHRNADYFNKSSMKIATFTGALAALLIGTGCRSTHNQQAAQPVLRVESIPNPVLSATSREGDKTPVYSSNIIAVYVDTNRFIRATNY